MLRALEERLATVLGADLPGPLAGRVRVRPASPSGNQPAAQVAIRTVTPVTPDFGAVRPEIAPGDPAARRIVRLEVQIDIRLTGGGNADASRAARAQALDDLIYFLDAPAVRSGAALRDVGDPGFLLERLQLVAANYAPDLDVPDAPDLTLSAVGWFWPAGTAGQDGPVIAEARIAQMVHPLAVDPAPARFVAGAAETEIGLRFADVQRISLRADGPGDTGDQRVAFQLLAADGSAGAGRLTNGRDLGDGVRSRPLVGGAVSIRYRPPATPGTDRLILRTVQEGDGNRLGPVLMELPLVTEAAS